MLLLEFTPTIAFHIIMTILPELQSITLFAVNLAQMSRMAVLLHPDSIPLIFRPLALFIDRQNEKRA